VSAVKAVRPNSVRPKAVKPQSIKPQAAKTQAVAVKPSSANMPLQTMAQKPFQQSFQQPTPNSVQKFLSQVPNRVVTTRKQINQQRPISSQSIYPRTDI